MFSVGCDVEKINRFVDKVSNTVFLEKIFSLIELDYCLSKSYPAQHLAVRFCAKEAVIKALSGIGINNILIHEIEIENDKKTNYPIVRILKKGYENLDIKISLSHDKDTAMAVAIISKNNI